MDLPAALEIRWTSKRHFSKNNYFLLFIYARRLYKINHELQKMNQYKAMTTPGVLPAEVVLFNKIIPKKHYHAIAIFTCP